MGATAARLLGRRGDVDLVVADADPARAEAVAGEVGAEARAVDAQAALAPTIADADAVATCLPYRLNVTVMDACLEAETHYADLGGLFHATREQLDLDQRFREAGLSALVGIGSAPGITNLLARLGADRLESVDRIDLFNGSIVPGGGFAVPYAPDTILDEFTLPAMVFEDGELREVPAATGAIRYPFPWPLGDLEAVFTLHSELATLPQTIEGVRTVRWRLALPPVVADGFRLLVELGLASTQPVRVGEIETSPRDLLLAVLRRLPPTQAEEHEVTIVEVEGTSEGGHALFVGTASFEDAPEGTSAGAFGTALPITVATRWLAEGRVPAGVHPPEAGLEAEPFLRELAAEGVRLTVRVEGRLG